QSYARTANMTRTVTRRWRDRTTAVRPASSTTRSTLPPPRPRSSPTVPTCARCDATTGVDDRYCMACGHRLGTDPVPEAPDPARTDTTLPPVPVPVVEDEAGLIACPT